MPPKKRAARELVGGIAKKRRGVGAVVLGSSPPCPDCPYGGTRERKGIRPSGRPKFRARCSRCQRESRSKQGTIQSKQETCHGRRNVRVVSDIGNSASVTTIAELLCEAAGDAGFLSPPGDLDL